MKQDLRKKRPTRTPGSGLTFEYLDRNESCAPAASACQVGDAGVDNYLADMRSAVVEQKIFGAAFDNAVKGIPALAEHVTCRYFQCPFFTPQ